MEKISTQLEALLLIFLTLGSIKQTNTHIVDERDNVIYWKTKRKINDDLRCN